MIIFGWGHQTIKKIGVVYKNNCSHCNNEVYLELARYRTWFTLFFIPVIPYKTKYFLGCPICQYGVTLSGDQLETIRPLAEANKLLIDGQISEAEYKRKIDQLGGEKTETEEVRKKNLTGRANQTERINFCSVCGAKINMKSNFCGKCGNKITTE